MIAVFAVGASPVDAALFCGRGCYGAQQMNFMDRTLCWMLKKSLLKKDLATLKPWTRAMLESEERGACDWCNLNALKNEMNE